MYEKASVTPLSTWMMKANSVALPNTYHQRAPGGARCASNGPSIDVSPTRSSTVFQSRFRSARIASSDRDRLGGDFDLAVAYAHRILGQAVGGRSGRDTAVFVVDAAMAGTHEESRRLDPTHRAAEVGAVDGEGHELLLARPAQPGGALGGDARPGERRGVHEDDADRGAELERGDFTKRPPLGRWIAEDRRHHEDDTGHGERGAAHHAQRDADLAQEFTPLLIGRAGVLGVVPRAVLGVGRSLRLLRGRVGTGVGFLRIILRVHVASLQSSQ